MSLKRLYYFKGDTYSEEILPFLKSLFPTIEFISSLDQCRWVVLTPTVDERALKFLNSLHPTVKVLLLLDWNFFGFDDYQQLLKTGRINLVYSPFKVDFSFVKQISSVHALMMKQKVVPSKTPNRVDFFFCSQPLREDRPELGFDQYDLMRETLKLAEASGVNLHLKRHPREKAQLPNDLLHHPRVKIWEGPLEKALSEFTHWYGYNTIALYDARELGHSVTFLREKIL